MLKKAGSVVALATAGLLAMSPLAFAGGNVDVTDQENEQESAQGNGFGNGNNLVSGNALQVCSVNLSGLNNLLGAVNVVPIDSLASATAVATTVQGGGDCNNAGTAVGQSTTQDAENDND